MRSALPQGPEILGVGEILWDLLPDGRVLGGAPFNFVFHCHQLGQRATIVSRVGDDAPGHDLRASLRALGLSDALIQTDPVHPTGSVSVTLQDGQPHYSIHEEVAWDYLQSADSLDAALAGVHFVCFGTLVQRHPVSRATVQRLLRMASQQAIVLCDVNLRAPFYTREILESSLQLARWVKLNDDELVTLRQLFQLRGRGESGWIAALRQRFDVELVALTRGAAGCLIQTADDEISASGVKVEVVDTIGAGDAFTAALVCATLEGRDLGEAATLANRYAATVATHRGGTPQIDPRQIGW
ncbi:MAG: carbohydrate kinase [Gemmataceae bacterium]